MSAVQSVNSNAEVVGKAQALMVNIGAAKGLQGVLKSNLGKRHALVSVPVPWLTRRHEPAAAWTVVIKVSVKSS